MILLTSKININTLDENIQKIINVEVQTVEINPNDMMWSKNVQKEQTEDN